jgi:hypothetical protein
MNQQLCQVFVTSFVLQLTSIFAGDTLIPWKMKNVRKEDRAGNSQQESLSGFWRLLIKVVFICSVNLLGECILACLHLYLFIEVNVMHMYLT